ncbi:MAG: hypothetical protein JO053_08325 [Acidobacteria bacterium]|nr:hypothetical protein [Acidobacteriota bacterium]
MQLKRLYKCGIALLFGLIFAGLAYGQTAPPAKAMITAGKVGSDDDTKKMPASKAETEKRAPTTDEQLAALADKLSKMEQIVDSQQQKIDSLQKQLSFAATGVVPDSGTRPYVGTPPTARDKSRGDDTPLTIHLGPKTTITPVGMVDLTAVFRSTNTGSVSFTNFNAIPYNNTISGHVGEFRLHAQNSRFGLRFDTDVKDAHVIAYMETDFAGNNPANLFVSSNSTTNRLRQFWLDYRHNKFEMVAGQTWSLMTPNREGAGPLNDNVFVTLNNDQAFQVGLPWARQAGIRFVYHANDNLQLAVAAENPQQFVGVGEVIFPFAFNAQLGPQYDAANNPGAPNLLPDVIGKVAYDSHGTRHFHVEGGGFMRAFRNSILPVGGVSFTHNTKMGGGAFANFNLEVAKGFHLVGDVYGSAGGGRYLGGLGPDVVIVPIQTGPTTFTTAISLVKSYSGLFGFEDKVNDKLTLDGYYGIAYFERNAPADPTNPVPGRFAGFGGTNSPNSAIRAFQQGTVGYTYTVWRDPELGALQWVGQGSYITRAPWFVPAGAPKNAHNFMGIISLRYVLPGKPPVDDK